MAKGDKTTNLIIKAKNEAKGELDSVKKGLVAIKKEAEQAQRPLTDARLKANRLKKELLGLEAKGVKKDSTEFKALESQLKQTQLKVKELRIAYSEARIKQGDLESSARNLNTTLRNLGGTSDRVEKGMRKVGNGTRQTLSYFQRMRGEVLSMSASFVGLYSTINILSGSVDKYNNLQAAQNGLMVASGGDRQVAAQEFAFVRQEADRLGLSITAAAGNYSKFSVAASSAGISNNATKQTFTAVAEAARVMSLSTDDTNAVFLALTQMMSKGKISAEELRGQLGDRLPGAMAIMADATGHSVKEFSDLLDQGKLFADEKTFIAFADKMSAKFGVQLPAAIDSLQFDLQTLENQFTYAGDALVKGGFGDALRILTQEMTVFIKSTEGQEAIGALSETLGVIVLTGRDFVVFLKNASNAVGGLDNVVRAFIAIGVAGVVSKSAIAVVEFGKSMLVAEGDAKGATGAVNLFGASVDKAKLATLGFSVVLSALVFGLTELWAEAKRNEMAMQNMETEAGRLGVTTDKLASVYEQAQSEIRGSTSATNDNKVASVEAKGKLESYADSVDRVARAASLAAEEIRNMTAAQLRSKIVKMQTENKELGNQGFLARQGIGNNLGSATHDVLFNTMRVLGKDITSDVYKTTEVEMRKAVAIAKANPRDSKNLDLLTSFDKFNEIRQTIAGNNAIINAMYSELAKDAVGGRTPPSTNKPTETTTQPSAASSGAAAKGKTPKAKKGKTPEQLEREAERLRKEAERKEEEYNRTMEKLAEDKVRTKRSIDQEFLDQTASTTNELSDIRAAEANKIENDFKDNKKAIEEYIYNYEINAKKAAEIAGNIKAQTGLNIADETVLVLGKEKALVDYNERNRQIKELQLAKLERDLISEEIQRSIDDLNNAESMYNTLLERYGAYDDRTVSAKEKTDLFRDALAGLINKYNDWSKTLTGDAAKKMGMQMDEARNKVLDNKNAMLSAYDVAEKFGDIGANSFDAFAEAIANGESGWKAWGDSMRAEIASFIRQLAMAIIKQKIMNALLKEGSDGSPSAASYLSMATGDKQGSGFNLGGFLKGLFKSTTTAATGGVSSGLTDQGEGLSVINRLLQKMMGNPTIPQSGGGWLSTAFNFGKKLFGFHSGGVGDSENSFSRLISITPKLHAGGIAGLKENERLRVLEDDEGVFTKGQMRAMGTGLGKTAQKLVVNNMIDSGDFVSKGLNDVKGQKAFFNLITNNKNAIKGILR